MPTLFAWIAEEINEFKSVVIEFERQINRAAQMRSSIHDRLRVAFEGRQNTGFYDFRFRHPKYMNLEYAYYEQARFVAGGTNILRQVEVIARFEYSSQWFGGAESVPGNLDSHG